MSKHSLTIGRIVHFMMPSGLPRPAIVVRTFPGTEPPIANLQVFTDGDGPEGHPDMFHATSVEHHAPESPGMAFLPNTWHWPDEHEIPAAEIGTPGSPSTEPPPQAP